MLNVMRHVSPSARAVSRLFRAFAGAALAAAAAGPAWSSTHPGQDAFVEKMVAEHGMEKAWVENLLNRADRKQSIIDAMTRPAEKSMPWHRYRKIFMTEDRIEQGVEFVRQHQALLAQVEAQFGVPPHIVAGIIGVETKYGRIMGTYRVVDALVTLGFHYPPRADFFRKELEELLLLARDESLDVEAITGSYAGAMGLGQFIPSSYRAYAVDFDGDGRRDLWGSSEDAIASVANYFRSHRWQPGHAVTFRVDASGDARMVDAELKPMYPLSQLADWGYSADTELDPDTLATLIELESETGMEYWAGLQNFYVITRYNRSKL